MAMWRRRQVSDEEVAAVIADMKTTAAVVRADAVRKKDTAAKLDDVARKMERLVARLEEPPHE